MGLGREHCHCRRREHDHRSPNSSKPNMAYGPQSECVIAAHNTDTQQLHLIQYGWPDSQAISIQSIRLWPPTFVRIEIAQFCEWHTCDVGGTLGSVSVSAERPECASQCPLVTKRQWLLHIINIIAIDLEIYWPRRHGRFQWILMQPFLIRYGWVRNFPFSICGINSGWWWRDTDRNQILDLSFNSQQEIQSIKIGELRKQQAPLKARSHDAYA